MSNERMWSALLIGALLVGCGDGGGASSSGSGGTTSTGGGGSGGTASTGGSGGSGSTTSSGGGGTHYETTKIGTPSWEPLDYHQHSVSLPTLQNPSDVLELVKKLLPPPNHGWNDNIGLVPGQAHAPPYDSELTEGVAALGLVEKTVFSVAEVAEPNSTLRTFMVIASEGSPQGSSPDFDSGAILPDSLFPIHVEETLAHEGVVDPNYTLGFDVPPMSVIAPELGVDGHSHFPMFGVYVLDPATAGGDYVVTNTMVDAEGNGWKIEGTFTVVP